MTADMIRPRDGVTQVEVWAACKAIAPWAWDGDFAKYESAVQHYIGICQTALEAAAKVRAQQEQGR